MALFFFLLAKTAQVYLPIAHFAAKRPRFSFWHAQYIKVFLLKPEQFCKLFAGLGSTNKFGISLLFFDNLTLALSSPPSFLMPQTLWQELSSLSPLVRSGCNGSPDIRFSWRTTRLMSWPDGERYSCPM